MLSPDRLAAQCRNVQPDSSHEPFCFELFRRSIAEGCTLCWHYLYDRYFSLVRYWVCRHASLDADTIDDLTQNTFFSFWRFYTPEKLRLARGLGDVLAYLKTCAASAVAQEHRQTERAAVEVEWDERVAENCQPDSSGEHDVAREVTAEELWAAVEAQCTDERDLLVARLTFLSDLKPGQIASRHPDLFPDVSDVYRIRRNLRDRLRRDPVLQAMHQNAGIAH